MISAEGLALHHRQTAFEPIDHEGIVIAVLCPGAGGHIFELDEFPIRHIRVLQAEIVANRRRNIQSRALVQIRFRTFVTKHILPMIGAKRARVLPLGVGGSCSLSNRDPAAFAG